MFKRPTPPDIETDLIIIGAGVTGITISEILLEHDVDFWMLGSPFDSQLAKAGELENTPLPEGTIGLKFIEKKFNDIKEKGLNHRSSLCTGIENKEKGFIVKTKFQNFASKYIIIATGNKQKTLGFEGEDRYFRKGISDCTVCDYPLFREKAVAVVGDHEYTIRATKLMRKYSQPVSLLWYQTKNPPDLEGVNVYSNVDNLVAEGDETLTKVRFNHAGGTEELSVRALFVEGKPVPSTDFISDINIELDNGFISVDDNFATNIDGIWSVGDITGKTKNYEEAQRAGTALAQLLLTKILDN